MKEKPIEEDERFAKLDEESKSRLSKRPILAYGCTLLCAYMDDKHSFIIKLGDGNAVIVDGNAEVFEPSSLTDEACVLNKTPSLCSEDCLKHFRYAYLINKESKVEGLLLFSDGVINSFSKPDMLYKFSLNICKLFVSKGEKYTKKQVLDGLDRCTNNGSGDDVSCAFILNRNKIQNITK